MRIAVVARAAGSDSPRFEKKKKKKKEKRKGGTAFLIGHPKEDRRDT